MKVIGSKDFNQSPFDHIGNKWMLITSKKKNGKINTMTASWGGLGVMWGKDAAFVFIRPGRYTKEFVDESREFSLSFYSEEHKKALGYLGRVSGRDEDKITKVGFTPVEEDGIPYFKEANAVILCKSLFAQQLDPKCFLEKELDAKWYPQQDYHTMYVGEVTKILEAQE